MVNQTELQGKRLTIVVGLQVVDRYVNEVKGISPIPFLFHSISSFKKCRAKSSSEHREQMGDLPLVSFQIQHFLCFKVGRPDPKLRRYIL